MFNLPKFYTDFPLQITALPILDRDAGTLPLTRPPIGDTECASVVSESTNNSVTCSLQGQLLPERPRDTSRGVEWPSLGHGWRRRVGRTPRERPRPVLALLFRLQVSGSTQWRRLVDMLATGRSDATCWYVHLLRRLVFHTALWNSGWNFAT